MTEAEMTQSTREVVESLYDAFEKRDGEAMAALYAEDAKFSDPVFPDLRGREIGGMWRMLTERGEDLELRYEIREVDGDRAKVQWQAWYTFSTTGRKVHNIIDADLRVRDGAIVQHDDDFDFGRWSRMAIGMPAVLLGWTGMIQSKVRKTARAQLDRFLEKRG